MRTGITLLFLAGLVGMASLSSPSQSQANAETYQVDPLHSTVVFRILHLNISAFYGRFNKVSGRFVVDDGGKGSVDLTIKAASIDTGNGKRDGHIKSPDFFSVKQFPDITFKSKDLRKLDGNRYEAKGTLTLHGVAKEITVKLERLGAGQAMNAYRTGFEGSFKISRSAFGMKWRPEALGDEVRIMFGIEGMRQ